MRINAFEIVTYYIYPSFRREVALFLKKQGWKQSDIASLLGTTNAAITQYLKGKRKGIELPKELKHKLHDLLRNESNNLDETKIRVIFNSFLKYLIEDEFICSLHLDFDPQFDRDVCQNCLFAKV